MEQAGLWNMAKHPRWKRASKSGSIGKPPTPKHPAAKALGASSSPSTGGFVCYYRVSTARQGKSGLGLEAQRAAVAAYLNGGDWRIIAEFTEVESGKRVDRPELDKALAAARLHRVPVVVAKVDRLTRSVAFLSRLLEAGVDVRFADLPSI
jgi:hypothetical protein